MKKRRRRNLPVIENLNISDIAADGHSLGRHNDFVVFVKAAVPGDVVDVQVTRKKKSFSEARVLKFKKYSENRVQAFCKHFNRCGGCKWQMLSYSKQLEYKQKQVADQFQRIGGFEFPEIKPIIKAEKDKFYRNKLEFTFSNRKWIEEGEPVFDKSSRELEGLGFHVQGMFDRIIDIEKCYLQDEPSNSIRNFVREYTKSDGYDYYNNRIHQGFMRNLIIRNTSLKEVMIILVFAEDIPEKIFPLLDEIYKNFPNINSIQYVINTKKNDSIVDLDVIKYKGENYINEKIGDLNFKIGAKTFFQTNSQQAKVLYDKVLELAKPDANEIAYDLYTGTGTIANYISKFYKKVIGIDNVKESIEHAELNSNNNKISNCVFFTGDMKDVFTDNFIKNQGKPDTLIVDPPRAGLHKDVVEVIRRANAKKLIYVSCNPGTQARDISMISDVYKVSEIQPVDMFPQTHHIENICLLESKV